MPRPAQSVVRGGALYNNMVRRRHMNIGIIGCGGIAEKMAATINQMEEVTLCAVAARDAGRAGAFAERYGAERSYGSYEELVSDKEVDLVYIATPHSHHYEHMKLCIEYGKNVLCEKAFTMNGEQARDIKRLANEAHVYVAEAIWTRYMPSRNIIDEVLASGIVGNICTVTCNLSYDIDRNERIVDPKLCGGALLDVGVYGLNFIVMHMGKDIDKIESSVMLTDTGVDGQESITIRFKNGTMAVTTHSIYGRSDRKGIFYGERGYIIVENINNPQSVDVYDSADKLLKHIDVPEQISGYEYQLRTAKSCIEKGLVENDFMPLDETIYMMDMMDGLRKSWGLVYPMETL